MKIDRRSFLKSVGALGGGMALAGCTLQSPPPEVITVSVTNEVGVPYLIDIEIRYSNGQVRNASTVTDQPMEIDWNDADARLMQQFTLVAQKKSGDRSFLGATLFVDDEPRSSGSTTAPYGVIRFSEVIR